MKLKYRIRSWWLELCLRMRVLQASLANSVPPLDTDEPLGYAGTITPTGRLYAAVVNGNTGHREELGLISTKVVTDAGVAFIVDAMQALADVGTMRFHASGTGTTAEAAGQTALVTEVGTRVSGTRIEGAAANVYRTVATLTYSGTHAITEHAVFSASSTGTMLDRSVFSAINVVGASGDAIEFRYDFTLPSGS